MKIDHILVATDLSPETLRACAPVTELARVVGARVTLLHVVQDLPARPHGAPLAPTQPAPDLQHRIDTAKEEIEEQRATFGGGEHVTARVISGADTPQDIVEFAKENAVDLIALSTHGRTGFRHLVLGSVAEGVLRHSDVPVVVLPLPKG